MAEGTPDLRAGPETDEQQILEELTQLGRETAESKNLESNETQDLPNIFGESDDQVALQNTHSGAHYDSLADLISDNSEFSDSDIAEILVSAATSTVSFDDVVSPNIELITSGLTVHAEPTQSNLQEVDFKGTDEPLWPLSDAVVSYGPATTADGEHPDGGKILTQSPGNGETFEISERTGHANVAPTDVSSEEGILETSQSFGLSFAEAAGVEATAIDIDTELFVDVTTGPNADAPTLTANDVAGNEDTAIAVDITSALTDTDGSETLEVVVSGMPAGATLSAGADNGDGTWTLTAGQLTGLTITPPADSDTDVTLTVTSTSPDGVDTAQTVDTFDVTVTAVADAPTLTANDVAGNVDTAIALDITSALTDTDGSETLEVVVSGMPAGASLSAGTDNGDGTWTLNPAQLSGLTILPPASSDTDFTLTVTSTSTDGADTAQTVDTFDVLVNNVETGTSGNDTLIGDGSNDSLTGMAGDDSLVGNSGDDTLIGDSGSVTAFSDAISSLSPVMHWKLNETSGTTVEDAVGTNDGTYTNGVLLGASGVDSGATAAEFDGTNDYIEIPHSSDMSLTDGTVQAWFNTNDATKKQAIFSRDSTGFDDGGHLTAFIEADGSISVRLQSISQSYFVQSAAGLIGTGNWHHIAFSFGANGMELFVDGDLVDTDAYTGGTTGNSEPLVIGANSWLSNDATADNLLDYFDGQIDEVAIFDEQLSQSDIDSLIAEGGDTLDGGAGDDSLVGDGGNDSLLGGDGADTLLGGTGTDTLEGGAGDDSLDGGAGDDSLDGGTGDDTLTGGDGSDLFIFGDAGGTDVIHGGVGGGWTDVIELQGDGGGAPEDGWVVEFTTGGIDNQGADYMNLIQDSSGTITMDDGSLVTFDGIEKIEW